MRVKIDRRTGLLRLPKPPREKPDMRAIASRKSNGRCFYCGEPESWTKDHIVPLSVGGQNVVRNLVLACRICNLAKGAELIRGVEHRNGVPFALRPEEMRKHVAELRRRMEEKR